MNECAKKQRNGLYAKKVDNRSIETAVEYLVEECLRSDDVKGAKILHEALQDLKGNEPLIDISESDERQAIGFLRQLLGLCEEDRLQLVCFLEMLENNFDGRVQ